LRAAGVSQMFTVAQRRAEAALAVAGEAQARTRTRRATRRITCTIGDARNVL